MKNLQKLAKRYGRLTVIGEHNDTGRRVAQVKCRCGRAKEVLVDSLLAGKTRSCGRGPCKNLARVKFDPDYTPRMPRAVTLETVAKAWARYNHTDPAQRRSIEQLAGIHHVNVNTLTSIFRCVRRAGGITKYMKALEQTDGT